MTAKEFLRQAYLIDQQIKSKSSQIKSLNDLANNCSSALTGMPRSHSNTQFPMANAVCKIIDLQNEVANDMDRLVEVKREIVNIIRQVEDVELRTLLEQRYLCGATWEEITIKLAYNRRWIFRLHNKGLLAVQKILDKKL